MLSFASLLVSCVLIQTQAVSIIDNGLDVRLVAAGNEHCNIGRVEFYDGFAWGSLTDCSLQFTQDIASSICQTLGWHSSPSFNHGPYAQQNQTAAPYATYTNVHCPSGSASTCEEDEDCDFCVQCQVANNFDAECQRNASISEMHALYDIYIQCANDEDSDNDPNSQLFNCTDYDYGDRNATNYEIYHGEHWNSQQFTSCSDAFEGETGEQDKHSHVWKFFVVAGIILMSVVCMLLYCKSTHRMKHQRFTDAYTQNLEDENDIMLEPTTNILASPQLDKYRQFHQ